MPNFRQVAPNFRLFSRCRPTKARRSGWHRSCYVRYTHVAAASKSASGPRAYAANAEPMTTPARDPKKSRARTAEAVPETTRAEAEAMLPKYEAEVERLIAQKAQLDREELRLRWIPLVGLVLGIATGWFMKPLYGLVPFAFGIVITGTGYYLTRVHHTDRDYNIGRARREITRLKAIAKAPEKEA